MYIWAVVVSEVAQKTLMTLWLAGKELSDLVDTGADVTIIRKEEWPITWSLDATLTPLKGIGQSQNHERSSKILNWKDQDSYQGIIQPCVIARLPIIFLGRDLSQLGIIMCSTNDVITTQMLKNGYLPGKNLGKHGTGILKPLEATPSQKEQD